LFKKIKAPIIILALLLIFCITAPSAEPQIPLPSLELGIGRVENPDDLVVTLEIILLLTIITLAPSILIMFTSFTRIMVVMGILRNAMGTRQSPPNQVLIALSLFLTMFIMWPVFIQTWDDAYIPYRQNRGYF